MKRIVILAFALTVASQAVARPVILISSSPGQKPIKVSQPTTMEACESAAAALRLIGYFDGTPTRAKCVRR